MTTTGDYVLGTHDAEIERLGMQHGVWRPRAIEAWQRAGIGPGQTVIDLGCGPGFATLDLAGVVGEAGRVIALDRSRRFLDVLERACAARGVGNVEARECDFAAEALPVADGSADAAWSRWVFSFVERPREVLARAARALRVGGALVVHEYFDYGAWRAAPRDAVVEDFVARVMASWRARGGEPDIGLDLLGWMPAQGLEIASVRAMIEVAAPGSPHWEWLQEFAAVGRQRLVELGELTADQGAALAAGWAACVARPGVRMVTPGMLEIVAIRR
jgi:SAM-dependent methyltransferase